MKRVGYQGVKGSFSERAALKWMGPDCAPIGFSTFKEVFDALASGAVELAVLPIENSLIGPICENLDLLYLYEAAVVGEVCLPIEHCLLVKGEGVKVQQLERVMSHPKALAQCTAFFESHPWIKPVVHEDTAGAALEISRSEEGCCGAIAGRGTAELYGLTLLQEHLEDDASNTTRFLILRKGASAEAGSKSSLLFTLPHEAGALAGVLEIFAKNGLNLTQIVSRPLQSRPFEYLFFVDISLPQGIDPKVVFTDVEKKTKTLRVLGGYDAAV